MSAAVRNRDILAIKEFLACEKRLKGGPPQWKPSSRKGDVQAIWDIVEEHGVERAHLRFRCATAHRDCPSLSLIFRDRPVWRVDIVPADECKYNPPWCAQLGLPATVCGPHEHNWDDNDAYLAEGAAWNLPARRPLPPQIRRVPQIIPWFCSMIKLSFEAEQRGFDVPPQTDLFSS